MRSEGAAGLIVPGLEDAAQSRRGLEELITRQVLKGTELGANYKDFISTDFSERPDRCFIIVSLCQLQMEVRSRIDLGLRQTRDPSEVASSRRT